MPIEQTEKFIVDTLQTPINNLLVGVAIAALAILALAILVFWKSSGFLARFFNVMTENIQKLTVLEQQNSEQSKNILDGLKSNTTEMTKQTAVIEGLSRDTRSYQTLVSDTLSGLGDDMKAVNKQTSKNTEAITELKERIEFDGVEIRKSIDELTEQIKQLRNKDNCADIEIKWARFKDDLLQLLQQPVNAVATNVVTVDASSLQDKAA